MMSRIRTTHTGSLARPTGVRDMLLAKDAGQAVDEQAMSDAIREAVLQIVQRQLDVGLAMINDGEQSKISFARYLRDRLHGFGVTSSQPRPLSGDAREFPGWARGRDLGDIPVGRAPLAWKDFAAVERDIANLQAATANIRDVEVFMTSASPGTLTNHQANRAYPSRTAYLEAAAEIMRREYTAIVEAGFLLQIDSPDLAASRDTFYADLSDEEFVRIAEENVEALNTATRHLPPERMRMHVCWGAGEGPHTHDIELRKIIEVLLRARPQAISVAGANGRHAHEWQVWRDVKLPSDKVVVPGVIDSTTNFVEHPETVAERILRYASVIPPERLMAGVDCGFGTGVTAAPPRVHPDVVWAKLRSLVEGAELASGRL